MACLLPYWMNTALFNTGEKIQKELSTAHVVKTLNTVNYKLMVDASIVNDGDHHLFVCGNNPDAKNKVKHFLVDNFNWKPHHFVDVGDIESPEPLKPLFLFG